MKTIIGNQPTHHPTRHPVKCWAAGCRWHCLPLVLLAGLRWVRLPAVGVSFVTAVSVYRSL